MDSWQVRFQAWQDYAQQMRERARRIEQMKRERAFAIAATVGLPPHALCIHNASLDTNCKGWSAAGPHVYKTARRARRLLDDWTASRLADKLISKAWDRLNKG